MTEGGGFEGEVPHRGATPGKAGSSRSRLDDLEFLIETAESLAATLDLDQIIKRSTRALAVLVKRHGEAPGRAAFHRLYRGRLEILEDVDEAGAHYTGDYPLEWNRAAERAIQTGRPKAVRESDLAPEIRALASEQGWRAGVLAPVRAGDRIYGLLIATARDRDHFHPEDERLMEVIARLTGLAIGHAENLGRHRRSARRMVALDEAKSEFMRLASHELRGPLTVINGYLSLVLDDSFGELAPAARQPLEHIAAKAREMDQIIELMLETARLEDSRLLLKLEKIDLLAIVREAIRSQQPPGDARIELRTPVHKVTVNADRERTAIIVGNLFSNAVKYSPPGSPVLARLWTENGAALVAVTDRGIGIAAEDLPKLFTRFGRITSGQAASVKGTGLGLYLSRELARLMEGDVVCESAAGTGSTFTLRLPLA